MTKIKMNGKTMLMALAFMILGSVSATAQWVSPAEAADLVKQELLTLENDFNAATTDAQRFDIAMETRYFNRVLHNVTEGGMEVPTAVEEARPTDKPTVHSSGLVFFSAEDPNFKNEAQALVDAGTDLLSF